MPAQPVFQGPNFPQFSAQPQPLTYQNRLSPAPTYPTGEAAANTPVQFGLSAPTVNIGFDDQTGNRNAGTETALINARRNAASSLVPTYNQAQRAQEQLYRDVLSGHDDRIPELMTRNQTFANSIRDRQVEGYEGLQGAWRDALTDAQERVGAANTDALNYMRGAGPHTGRGYSSLLGDMQSLRTGYQREQFGDGTYQGVLNRLSNRSTDAENRQSTINTQGDQALNRVRNRYLGNLRQNGTRDDSGILSGFTNRGRDLGVDQRAVTTGFEGRETDAMATQKDSTTTASNLTSDIDTAQGRVETGFGNLASRLGGTDGRMRDVEADYGDRVTGLDTLLGDRGIAERERIRRQFAEREGQINADMQQRGLGNTTVRTNRLDKNNLDREFALQNLDSQLRGERVNLAQQTSADELSARERGIGLDQSLIGAELAARQRGVDYAYETGRNLQGAQAAEANMLAGLRGDRLASSQREVDLAQQTGLDALDARERAAALENQEQRANIADRQAYQGLAAQLDADRAYAQDAAASTITGLRGEEVGLRERELGANVGQIQDNSARLESTTSGYLFPQLSNREQAVNNMTTLGEDQRTSDMSLLTGLTGDRLGYMGSRLYDRQSEGDISNLDRQE